MGNGVASNSLYYSYMYLGILNGMRGNAEASLPMFLAQPRLNQQRPGILSNIANSYYSQGKYAAATGMLAQVRRADAAAHDTAGVLSDLVNLNQVLLKQGQALAASQQAVLLLRQLPRLRETDTGH